ncbi:hypothetical protein FHK92_05280 [Pseudomonas brassicacearum subsp. neoaurantiaca]|uniref:Uncharacterized protein n=1 Tax=Pseudomonas brassicacearum subsp. neoaurantiaca TaxID=494916 RepID=A0A7V8RIN3_9PSED|nr:hypothetical protein [Pseudomonas brassicacearum subsp. neoaurantiaca]
MADAGVRQARGDLAICIEPVGASLLAIAVDQPLLMLTDTPPSRASSLPQFVLGKPEHFR